MDSNNETTTVSIGYFYESSQYSQYSFVFDEIWDSDDEILIYVGSSNPSQDDYYRFKDITLQHCSDEWDIPTSFCEEMTLNYSSLGWNGADSLVTAEGEIIHGWLSFDDNLTLVFDELPYWSQVIVTFDLYVTNFNNLSASTLA